MPAYPHGLHLKHRDKCSPEQSCLLWEAACYSGDPKVFLYHLRKVFPGIPFENL